MRGHSQIIVVAARPAAALLASALFTGCATPAPRRPPVTIVTAPPPAIVATPPPATTVNPPLPPGPPKARNVPPDYLASRAIFTPAPRRPPEFRNRGERLMFKICVAVDGKPMLVAPVTVAPPKELDAIIATVAAWRFQPLELPLCALFAFEFTN